MGANGGAPCIVGFVARGAYARVDTDGWMQCNAMQCVCQARVRAVPVGCLVAPASAHSRHAYEYVYVPWLAAAAGDSRVRTRWHEGSLVSSPPVLGFAFENPLSLPSDEPPSLPFLNMYRNTGRKRA